MSRAIFLKGDRVTYNDGNKPPVQGKVKSRNDTFVFVVFNCNDEWDDFENYTAQGCNPSFLEHGWESTELLKQIR